MKSNLTNEKGLQGNETDAGLKNMEQVLVPVFDMLILVLGVVGQTMVMWILCRRRVWRAGRMGQPPTDSMTGSGTDTLLLALSLADMILLTVLPFHTIAMAMQRWPFEDFLCRLVSFLGSACSSASAFTLATLAVSRYLTVAQHAMADIHLTPRKMTVVAALLWVPACSLAVPQLVFRSVGTPRRTPDGLACFAFLSHRDQMIYGLCYFLIAFLFPLVVIVVAYSSIYMFLWRTQAAVRAPQVERYQSKVTQTLAMLVLAFTLCWLPSYGLTLALVVDNASGATGTSPRYGPFSVFARLMASSSTVVNPILYVLMSQKFREDLLQLFRSGHQNTSLAMTTAPA